MIRLRSVLVPSDISACAESTMTHTRFRIERDYTILYLKHVGLGIARWAMASSADGGAAC